MFLPGLFNQAGETNVKEHGKQGDILVTMQTVRDRCCGNWGQPNFIKPQFPLGYKWNSTITDLMSILEN